MKLVRTPQANPAFKMTASPFKKVFNTINKPPAKITGMDKSMENSAASFLFNFKKRPAVMVIPERLVPGIKANAWKQPMTKAFLKVISPIVFSPGLEESATYNKTPKKMEVQAIIYGERKDCSIKELSKPPAATAGNVPMISFKSKVRPSPLENTPLISFKTVGKK